MYKKIVTKIFSPIKCWVVKLRKKAITEKEPIFIFSEGRGGSTWLMEVVQHYYKGVSIFEPFGGKAFGNDRCFSDFPFPFYSKEGVQNVIEFLNYVKTLNGVTSRNVRFNTFRNVRHNSGLVVKVVNKTLMLPVLLDSKYFKERPILLVRNPIEIIYSRVKYGLDNFQKERKVKVNEIWNLGKNHILGKEMIYLETLETNFELYVAEWCITHLPFLASDRYSDAIHLVFYSEMKKQPNIIINNLGSTYNWFKDNPMDFSKKSGSSTRVFKANYDSAFLPNFDNRMEKILNHFKLDLNLNTIQDSLIKRN